MTLGGAYFLSSSSKLVTRCATGVGVEAPTYCTIFMFPILVILEVAAKLTVAATIFLGLP
jgi:hypothetical protein